LYGIRKGTAISMYLERGTWGASHLFFTIAIP
jgi:hypothetical protein